MEDKATAGAARRASDDAALTLRAMADQVAFAIRYDRSVDRVDDCCHRRLPTRIGVEDTTSQPFRKALAAPASCRAGTALFRAWTSTVASLGPTIHAALPYHRDWAYPPG